ncbi:MAG TPA: outer membrane beta-barrel protein [Cyclobacteriaceae bacterium]|nr:outer membrane beta-barrel protein [Cyclobacteriaceae bacterium]
MRRLFLLCCIFFVGLKAYAQEQNCANVLQQAQEDFIAGKFYGIAATLKQCLERGFSNEQKRDAYLLLTRAYLYIDDPIGAENAYLNLLAIDPEYIPFSPRDPIELIFLSQRFTTRPIFTLHTKVGLNLTTERVIAPVSLSGLSDSPINTNPGIGFHLSGGIEYNVTDLIALGTELNIHQRSFSRNTFLVRDPQFISISQFLIETPLYLKFQKNHGAIRPFGYAGFAFNFLVTDGWTVELTHLLGELETDPTNVSSSSRINTTPARNRINRSLYFGGGILYKIGANFFKAELSYMAGLNNYVNTKEQLNYAINNANSSYNQILNYGYVDNYFSVNNWGLSIGYVKPLYKPRLKKNPSIKSLDRRLNKSDQQLENGEL